MKAKKQLAKFLIWIVNGLNDASDIMETWALNLQSDERDHDKVTR